MEITICVGTLKAILVQEKESVSMKDVSAYAAWSRRRTSLFRSAWNECLPCKVKCVHFKNFCKHYGFNEEGRFLGGAR